MTIHGEEGIVPAPTFRSSILKKCDIFMYCRHHEVCSSDLTKNMLHFLMGNAFSGGKQVPLGGA